MMKIKFWGARGSIPVSGKEYLKYGGDTTCLELTLNKGDRIIIDAGSGLRRLGKKMLNDGIKEFNIMFTHSHWDHILGFPFFKPIYQKDTVIKMYGAASAQQSIRSIISKTMQDPYFPVRFDDVCAEIVEYTDSGKEYFQFGQVSISSVPLSHPNGGKGFRFEEMGKSFVFITDNELTYRHKSGLDYKDYVDFSRSADLLIHDSEYKEEEYKYTREWGHTVYLDALNLAIDAGVASLGLFHHNQDRTDDEIDDMVGVCRKIIRDRNAELECFAVSSDMEIVL